jgi:hypothetical protein
VTRPLCFPLLYCIAPDLASTLSATGIARAHLLLRWNSSDLKDRSWEFCSLCLHCSTYSHTCKSTAYDSTWKPQKLYLSISTLFSHQCDHGLYRLCLHYRLRRRLHAHALKWVEFIICQNVDALCSFVVSLGQKGGKGEFVTR